MIAYDLDGVLLPDYNHCPHLTEQEFYDQTLFVKPLFSPKGQFVILTARPESQRPRTIQWLEQLTTKPQQLIMRPDSFELHYEYKLNQLELAEYSIFLESDLGLCEFLWKNYKGSTQVVHYSSQLTAWINQLKENK